MQSICFGRFRLFQRHWDTNTLLQGIRIGEIFAGPSHNCVIHDASNWRCPNALPNVLPIVKGVKRKSQHLPILLNNMFRQMCISQKNLSDNTCYYRLTNIAVYWPSCKKGVTIHLVSILNHCKSSLYRMIYLGKPAYRNYTVCSYLAGLTDN